MSVKSFKTSGVGVDLAPKGLVLINTTSFSGVASQSVNDVFSTTYDNYRIVLNNNGSAGSELLLRVRVGGGDNTSSNYVRGALEVGVQASITFASTNNSTGTSHAMTYQGSNIFGATIDICSPFLSENTTIQSLSSGNSLKVAHTVLNVTTSYTGFTIFSSNASNINGRISVYGYNK